MMPKYVATLFIISSLSCVYVFVINTNLKYIKKRSSVGVSKGHSDVIITHMADTEADYNFNAIIDKTKVGEDEELDDVNVGKIKVDTEEEKSNNNFITTIQASNSNSTLLSEIVSITYDTSKSQPIITINFDTSSPEYRKCRRPIVRGRLSGPALTMIDWEDHYMSVPNNNTSTANITDKLIGRVVNVPFPGKYFIEIVGILCNKFDFNNDFKETCVENPISHRLTANDAFINIIDSNEESTNVSNENVTSDESIGHWILNQQNNASKLHAPLYTRFQPLSCRKPDEIKTSRCDDAINTARYDNYQFQFTDEAMKSIENSLFNASVIDHTAICSVGFSHSRLQDGYLQMAWRYIEEIKQEKIQALVRFRQVAVRFPSEITPDFMLDLAIKGTFQCTDLVVAIGQWPGYRHVSFPAYQKEMEEAILNLLDARKKMNYRIYLRSIHYTPLGDWSGTCPLHYDWRHPFVIDGYNDILRGLSMKYDLPFIDTNFVVSPMWDHSSDWCHLDKTVGIPECLYILSKVMEQFVPK